MTNNTNEDQHTHAHRETLQTHTRTYTHTHTHTHRGAKGFPEVNHYEEEKAEDLRRAEGEDDDGVCEGSLSFLVTKKTVGFECENRKISRLNQGNSKVLETY